MIVLLHGDDISASRFELTKRLSSFSDIVTINGAKTNETETVQALQSQDLFLDKKAVVIENFQKIPDAQLAKVIKIAKDSEILVLLWTDELIPKYSLKKYSTVTVLEFSFPKTFYTFLDELIPSRAARVEELFQSLPKNLEAEQVFYSIIKRIRQLLILKTGAAETFKETKLMPSWQISKLQRQASAWNMKKLINFYQKLFEIEVNLKTSGLSIPLSTYLDIFLLTELH